MKYCAQCEETLEDIRFYRRANGSLYGMCIKCNGKYQRAYKLAYPEKIRQYNAKWRYGLEDISTLLKKQESKCPVCKRDLDKYVVDHDHKTGKVRGLLHNNCNAMLGYAEDNIAILQGAIEYLS